LFSKILLIRHGRSAHVSNGAWLSREGVLQWREAYDTAGIAPEESPPAAVLSAVARCDIIVSSDLPRALESAQRLAPGRTAARSPLLREAPQPVPYLPGRFPLLVWNTLMTMIWGFRILQQRDASQAELARAADAVTWLESLGQTGGTLAVVTHGVFRRLLANRFAQNGWNVPTKRRSYKWWSVWLAEK
jgi:broad specificity phosphatase PhoE